MAEPADLKYSVLPTETVGLYAEENLRLAAEEALRPEIAFSAPLPNEPVEPIGRGWAFDFTTGQFIRHGQSPARVSGEANLKMWIIKTLSTARGAHSIYSDTYGINLHDWIGSSAAGGVRAAIENALLAHDHIRSISDFTSSVENELLEASFAVNLTNGTSLNINLSL